ncbi:MAG: 1-(5-phosphoribosyl)-5-[(5-phosphoribosylamino)methylideneamino]imidazole-4-carboxamide isomerase [Candidatus Caenarcaniphilales bacterium]|nr:1-(5-phosphoribosyl)-5-[(5-phosphoribosylamino)methylideneamino]imidazole-4-carboxamide isomerase [Candidatus Caenarcaniphilales bacterium]
MIDLIPAIDLLDNKVVRLKIGDYNQVTEYGSPLECANYWIDQGVKRLHVVDLDGAKVGKLVNIHGLQQILSTGIQVQFGGGVRSWDSIEHLFELGIRLVILGTAAVKDPELMKRALKVYKDRIILALDSREGKVSVEGWLEDSQITIQDLLNRLRAFGLSRFIYTDVTRDGMLKGPDISGAIQLCKSFKEMHCILSGGVSSLEDLQSIREQTGDISNLEGIISGKALYEKKFSYKEAIEVLSLNRSSVSIAAD